MTSASSDVQRATKPTHHGGHRAIHCCAVAQLPKVVTTPAAYLGVSGAAILSVDFNLYDVSESCHWTWLRVIHRCGVAQLPVLVEAPAGLVTGRISSTRVQ